MLWFVFAFCDVGLLQDRQLQRFQLQVTWLIMIWIAEQGTLSVYSVFFT